jgi:hypothetical protein
MEPSSRFRIAGLLVAVFLTSCGGGDERAETQQRREALAGAQAVAAPALGATWTQLPNPNYAPPAGPYARAWTEMTWDSNRQEIVLFGGNGPNLYENDVWAYNGTTANWENLDPHAFCPGNQGFTKPNGTDDTAFKYDPINNLYWAFGAASGYRCLSWATVYTADAGTSSSTLVDAALPTPASGTYVDWRVRVGSSEATVSAYNAATKTLTLKSPLTALTAGSSYQVYATTGAGVWYFNPVSRTWVGQDTPAGNTGPTPTGARIAPAVAFSTADKAFALFGGWGSGSDRRVWKLDVTTKLWTQLPMPATAPPHMRELLNSFVYDKQNDVFILFGGQCSYDATCPDNTFNAGTWAYKLSTNTWTNMGPSQSPPPRGQHLMSYDEEHGVVVLHGGVVLGGTIVNDTWYYHYPSNTWTQVSPANPPTARYLAQVAYDPLRRQTVIFGGQGLSGMRADIWGLKLFSAVGLPTVALTSPMAGSTYTLPATIPLAANAQDTDGNVVRVEFYTGTTKIGEDLSAPYTTNWSPSSAGTYSLTAVVTDNSGNRVTSAPVSVTVTAGNQPPTAAISSPTAGQSFAAPASIPIAATAADTDGSIAKVEFHAGGVKIGEDLTAPFTLTWTGATVGTHTLTVVATDNQGATTTSAGVNVTVTSINQAPTVTIGSPAAGSQFTAPASFTISVAAGDSDGTVTKVEYFAGATKLGETTSAPHSFAWSNIAAGSYALTAVATDNLGSSTTSSPVNVTVNTPSGGTTINLALPANGSVATASSRYSANHQASGAINGARHCRDLGNGGVWVDQTTNQYPDWLQVTFNGVKTIDRIDVFTMPDNTTSAGNPVPGQTFSLYGITAFDVQYWTGSAWSTVPGGSVTGNNLVWRTFSFAPVATDRVRILVKGATSYGLSFICEVEAWAASGSLPPNDPPSVSLTSPSGGGSAPAPATIVLAANASDSDGSIARVEFFAGTTKLGEDTTAPYGYTWSNAPAGSYMLTAVATDNNGATTVSGAVNFTVTPGNQPPTVAITSPSNQSAYTAPASFTITANAADSDGSVAKVEYFAGSTKLGQSTSAPHAFTVSGLAAGNYALTAVATDNQGATSTSAAVAITVTADPGGAGVNVALQAYGSIASASSRYSANHPAAGAQNGNRHCRDLGSGGVWVDQTTRQYPDWLQVTFNQDRVIDRIEVFTMPDNTTSAGNPTPGQTFSLYGVTAFDVQYWNGSAWTTVPGGSVTGNNLIWRTFSFAPITTDRVRVLVNAATNYGLSFICELEAWSPS